MIDPNTGSFPLRLQSLALVGERILVLGQMAGLQNANGRFIARQVDSLFDAFHIPRPSKTGTILGQLAERHLVVRLGTEWALTPLGEERVRGLGEQLGQLADPRLLESFGAELGHARHSILPPTLAPSQWSGGISQLLKSSPFETNVFCMTRFPEPTNEDPIGSLIEACRRALRLHGLRLHLASDAIVDDGLLANVAAYMWACKYGLALFENRVGRGLNYNLVIEVGAMIMAGRRCVLLRDSTAPAMPTDFVGQIYKSVDFTDLRAISEAIHRWTARDLGLTTCPECPRTAAA